jgi:hypothetical protein
VDLTLFTTWLNDAWKITVVDGNNFDLDGAVWQTTADNNGTVTPRGGSSWTDAWITTTNGASAARIQPGDTLRIAKTADPVSLGQNATWTNESQTVTLTTAVTKKIENAISGWTAATNVTVSTNTARKIGASSVSITPAAGFTTGKMAYKAIDGGGTQDFSGYQKINLWFSSLAAVAYAASDLRICLCSDATGDVIVDSLNFPATLATSNFTCLVLNKGSALGSNIQSVAIYSNIDPGTNGIRINNIFAGNDLSLKTLIGKNEDVNYNIQSIDGTTIKIDSNNTSAAGRGYSGDTSTETLYYQVPFDVSTTSNFSTINETGNEETGLNTCTGGWNTSTNLQDGMTVLGSTVPGTGTVFASQVGWIYENFKIARFAGLGSVVNSTRYNNIIYCGGAAPLNGTAKQNIFNNCKFLNCSIGMSILGYEVYFKNCLFLNLAGNATNASGGFNFLNCTFKNNGGSSLSISSTTLFGTGSVLLRNTILADTIEASFIANVFSTMYSFNHDNTPGNHWAFHNGGTVNWQTAVKQGSDPGAWRTVTTNAFRNSFNPIIVKIAEVACAAGSLVTVKVWMKKDHATHIGAAIYVEDALFNIEGVVATETTKANNTNWEELALSFTPSEAGIVPIFGKTWNSSGNSSSYIGSITVTQA